MLTKEQKSFYEHNGYVIIENILSNIECDFYLSNIEKFANKDYAAIMNPDRMDFLLAQSEDKLRSYQNLHDKVSFIKEAKLTSQNMRNILSNAKAVEVLEKLQGNEVVGLMSQMLFKKAGTVYANQAWSPHQDNAYPKNSNGQYLTTNFFFSDANKENGSLYVYLGSHKSGLFNCKESVSYREQKGSNPGNTIDQDILNRYKRVDIEFKKGDMLVLHGNCVHGSYPNESNISRPLFSCSYITKGEKFIAGKNAQRREINLH